MCDALSHVPGVEHVVLEFDARGNGVLRVQVPPEVDQDVVVGAAVTHMRHRFGLSVDASRLRLTGSSGRTVIAVVESLDHGKVATEALASPAEAEPVQVPDAPRRPRGRMSVPAPVGADAALDTALDAVLGRERRTPLPQLAAEPEPEPRPEPVPEPEHQHDEPLVTPAARRVVVERVELSQDRRQVRASVYLRNGESLHEGTALGGATGGGSLRAVATATARAVESAVGSAARLDVEAVDLLQVGSDQVGVVVLTLVGDSGIDRLTGSALVRTDARDAMVRATLDALNRRAAAAPPRWQARPYV